MNKHQSHHGHSGAGSSGAYSTNNSGSLGGTGGNGNAGTGVNGGVLGHHNNNHNSSPILPITPSTSVSPPINVICKKEQPSAYHTGVVGIGSGANTSSLGGSADSMKLSQSQFDVHAIKDEMSGMSLHASPSPYSNISSRLGQTGGNLTPLGSNSTIMSTPSPPNTPQTNQIPYHHPNEYFLHQYPQYPGNYNSNSYYPMDYWNNQSQANYNMGHAGYGTSNFGLSPATTLNGSMGGQAFAQNGLDYMSPQDKYMNMNVNA